MLLGYLRLQEPYPMGGFLMPKPQGNSLGLSSGDGNLPAKLLARVERRRLSQLAGREFDPHRRSNTM